MAADGDKELQQQDARNDPPPLRESMEGRTEATRDEDRWLREKADKRVIELISAILREAGLVRAVLISLALRLWERGKGTWLLLQGIWAFGEETWKEDRPEREFVKHLLLDTGVALSLSVWLRVVALLINNGISERSFITTIYGKVFLPSLHIIHYIPLGILFLYQIVRFCRMIVEDWKNN